MAGKQLSNNIRKWFDGEIASWAAGGIISNDQANQIKALYETETEVVNRQQSIFSFALMGLAGLMVGLALFLVIGHNWDVIPWGAKLVVIFGALLGLQSTAIWLKFARQSKVGSELVFFMGCLFYGAGITLVAQIFHLDAHYPDGIWWWAAAVLPVALCLETPLVHLLLISLLALWSGMEVIEFDHLVNRFFWGWWSMPNGAYSLPLLAAPGLVWCYRHRAPWTLTCYLALAIWWLILQAVAWDFEWQSVYVAGVIGSAFLIIGELHDESSRFGRAYRFWGVVAVASTLIPLSFGEFYRSTSYRWYGNEARQHWLLQVVGPATVMVLLFLATLVGGVYLSRSSTDSRPVGQRVSELISRQKVPFGLAFGFTIMCLLNSVFPQDSYASYPTFGSLSSFSAWTIPANVGMIGLALWLMQVGLNEDRVKPFIFGVVYFLLWSILRYVDLFSEVGGMLGAAGMFFLCGATMFGMAIYWRKRKQVQNV